MAPYPIFFRALKTIIMPNFMLLTESEQLKYISAILHQKLKREVSRMEKRFKIAIMFSGRRRRSREERNGFVKADVIK